jgi:hypothetical protein
MAFLSKVFKSKDAKTSAKHKAQKVDSNQGHMPMAKPRFVSNWNSREIDPEEVDELIQVCTLILKSRGTQHPQRHRPQLLIAPCSRGTGHTILTPAV